MTYRARASDFVLVCEPFGVISVLVQIVPVSGTREMQRKRFGPGATSASDPEAALRKRYRAAGKRTLVRRTLQQRQEPTSDASSM